jgi:hypothetical protein
VTTGGARAERVVGTVGGPVVRVDRGGGLRFPDGTRLEWWIGADDRWRFPTREVATRPRLVDGLPVAETAVRVPGGDAVHRCWVLAGPPPLAVVEIENASGAPFAVALVTQGPVPLTLARPVGASAAAGSVDAVRRLVTGGRAIPGPPSDPDAGRRADVGVVARLVPMAHRTSLRVAVPLSPPTGPGAPVNTAPAPAAAAVDPHRLPGPDTVRRGWRRLLDGGARVELGDGPLQEAIATATARLLLPVDDGERRDPVRVAALAAWGFAKEASAAITGDADEHPDAPPDPGPTAEPREHPALAPTALAPTALAPTVASPEAVAATPSGLAPVDAPGAWAALGPPDDPGFLLAVRSRLVRDDGPVLELLPGFPESWQGRPVEVHGLPTAGGTLSFAVRWHGERPAVLWDLRPPAAPPAPPPAAPPAAPVAPPPPGAAPPPTSTAATGTREPPRAPPQPPTRPTTEAPTRSAPPPANPPMLRASSIDPHWVGRGWRGEALLRR